MAADVTPHLAAEDFPAFFRAIQRWDPQEQAWIERETFDPFPWQERLIREIARQDRWPDLLDLPTGSGKTVAIDIAVFHLALQAGHGEARRAAMRIAFVVDRRLVVDEAFSRAKRLAAALLDAAQTASSAPGIVRTVAERLRRLAGEDRPPLIVRSLRGGAPREDDWARTPCQPTVLCSTVDQVGSRLLFRGYGVSDSMRPVQAGLLGSDALILLDEAHLSQPFRQTVKAITRYASIRGPDAAPFHVALLTATPGEKTEDERRFGLCGDDRDNPILAKRLQAPKPVTLHDAGPKETTRVEALAEHACKLIDSLRKGGVAAPVVGVIANRVGRARAVFERLTAELGDTACTTLVIGRARSVHRDWIAKTLEPIKTGAEPRPGRPFVVVATQTLEAGVDIDLDAMVTDAASVDALRQRFGRVNRSGRDIAATGVVIADKVDRNLKKPDPVYGEAIARTLEAVFPEGGEPIDFGIDALNAKLATFGDDVIREMLSDKADAPVLMPAYADLWSHTAPIPATDPDPALFLHGPNREPASVQLVWRADLDLALGDEGLRMLLALAPPRAAETIELPVWTVRRWLAGDQSADLADVAQAEGAEAPERSPKGPAFRWRGADDDRSRIVEARDIRPGDMIVVPSRYGGCDRYGWKPEADVWAMDVSDEASKSYDGKRYVVRIAPGLIRQAVFDEPRPAEEAPVEPDQARQERLEAHAVRLAAEVRVALQEPASSQALIAALLDIGLPAQIRSRLARLRDSAKKGRLDRPAYPYGGEDGDRPGVVLVAPFGVEEVGEEADIPDAASTEDDEVGSFNGSGQALAAHSKDVKGMAGDFGRRAGFREDLAADLALAGWLHDAGKADIRFQRLLFNGDLLALEAKGEALAKSEQGRSSPGAWARAGLPPHWRHEALSVRMALANPRLQEAHDRALVLWLVGTHHGHGRPFFPHADRLDGETRELAAVEGLADAALGPGIGPQSLGFVIEGEDFGPTERDGNDLRGLDWATMFRDLKRRYGPWGLARLEAVLRLADHRASEASRDKGTRP